MKRVKQDELTITDCISARNLGDVELMCSQFRHHGEHLWKGTMPINSFSLMHHGGIYSNVFRYFENKCYNNPAHEICDNDIDVTNFWLEIFPKIIWLCDDWFKNNGFKDPLMSHWNPRIEKNVIHPGMTRANVIDMFGDNLTDIDVVYFNTGGDYNDKFMSQLNQTTWKELFNDNWNVFTFVADHGSVIPHFSKLVETNANYKKQYHLEIVDRLKAMRLAVNKISGNFEYIKPWIVTNNHDVEIVFKEPEPSMINQCRAIICALLKRDFENDFLIVKNI